MCGIRQFIKTEMSVRVMIRVRKVYVIKIGNELKIEISVLGNDLGGKKCVILR